jgi:hypothetical protein
MKIRDAIEVINRMEGDGIIRRYAIGGAVGATFYLEPIATMDIDIFVALRLEQGRLLVNLNPISKYLTARGGVLEGEYIRLAGWPVQFLPAAGGLVEEALAQARETDIEGTFVRVFSAEHLAGIALQTGRAKDKARLLQFLEADVLDMESFRSMILRHGLEEAWRRFELQFRNEKP